MTVIDVFLDRPNVVPKQKISTGTKKRKSSKENHFMPEIQGCIIGNVLAGDSNQILSMESNGTSADGDVDTQLLKEKEENSSSSLTSKKQKILVKTNRTPVRNRRKSRWKLKFHHQALPPEYLRHYKQQERKRRQTETNKTNQVKVKNRKPTRKSVCDKGPSEKFGKNGGDSTQVTTTTTTTTTTTALLKMENDSGVRGDEDEVRETERLKVLEPTSPIPAIPKNDVEEGSPKPAEMSLRCRSTEELLGTSLTGIPHLNIDVSQNKAFLENLLTNQIEINRVEQTDRKVPADVKSSLSHFNKLKNNKTDDVRHKSYSIPPSGKIMNYSDLPYMGEITLDGIKPRRGRKPKKADICHLIYKNYGQVFPGAPSGRNSDEDPGQKPLKWGPEMNRGPSNSSQRTKATSLTTAILGGGGNSTSDLDQRMDSTLSAVSGFRMNHAEVQNRIINSLLEKRLTQGIKVKSYASKEREDPKGNVDNGEEPLNLCIRDLQSLKIKLSRKHGNFYETKQRNAEVEVKIKTELEDGVKTEVINIDKTDSEPESTDDNEEEDDLAPFNLVTTELRESSDDDTFLNFNDQITLTRVKPPPTGRDAKEAEAKEKLSSVEDQKQNPVLFWPGGNFFLPGMSNSSLMCYPKVPGDVGDPMNFNMSPVAFKRPSPGAEKKSMKTKGEGHRSQLKRLAPNVNSAKPAHVITKRKRSAIFIPPVPAESTTNPTTEVSICKFKFTGGAKPSLQEKKMLSVDSGGNFRYYSGTGDKSMRGYEYFPRESLQQCQENTGCSPSGVFLTASALGSGEKIPEEIGHSGFFDTDFPLQVPPTPKPSDTVKLKSRLKSKKLETERRLPPDLACYQTLREHLLGSRSESSDVSIIPNDLDREDGNSSDQSVEGFDLRNLPPNYFDAFKIQEESSRMSSKSDDTSSRSKKFRKSRKSLAREKLEQTFKEKGFLIQTQQLESAEGATYCKFRQLRKFTRYLFRSWKDYLPGNVRNLSVDAGVDNPEMLMEIPEAGIKMETLDADGNERFK